MNKTKVGIPNYFWNMFMIEVIANSQYVASKKKNSQYVFTFFKTNTDNG